MSGVQALLPPGWRWAPVSPRVVWLASLLLALTLLVLVVAFLGVRRAETLDDEREKAALVARVLEDHSTRSLHTVSLTLAALAEVIANRDAPAGANLRSAVTEAAMGLPVLRGLALVNAQGQVLSSTSEAQIGHVVDLARLGGWPEPGTERLGSYMPGLGLEAIFRDRTIAVPSGIGFLPMLRRVPQRPGSPVGPLLLVALINPEAVTNHKQRVLSELGHTAVLASPGGLVLAATSGAGIRPGESIASLPVFTGRSPEPGHAVYVGVGVGGTDQVVAFRASDSRPLVVVVEASVEAALRPWRPKAYMVLALAVTGAAVIVLLGLLASRSLRAGSAAQQQRDDVRAQSARRERELQVVVGSVHELLFRADASGRLTFVNARWEEATGLPEARLLGRPLADFVHPDSRAAVRDLFLAPHAVGLRMAAVRMGPEGFPQGLRHYNLSVTPLHEDREWAGFAGSAVDMTEQRQVKAQLRLQLAFTELLVDVMPVPLAVLDLQGRQVSVNRAWAEFSGPESGGVPRPVVRRGSHERPELELAASAGRVRYEARAKHHDGTLRDLVVTQAAIPGADGDITGSLMTFIDVTEFREAERATRLARDMAERASRAKTEFIANISHELRTPLQSIIGFSELGLERGGDAHRTSTMFGKIHASGQRMLALVADLLDLSKIESTVGTVHLGSRDLRTLVGEVADELAPQLNAKQLQLDLQLGDAALVAKVDPLRFQQVVRNVLANAIRFSPAGSPLQVLGGLDATGAQVQLVVIDQGPGIPPEELDKIFEAFVQSSKTKDGSGGTGLGLAISRKILQAHGGSIRAENKLGGGACFRIVLPVRDAAHTQPGSH